MEKGELKATEEKFLAFAKGLSDKARAGGALEAVTKKTRAEMNRFFKALTMGKDELFQGGMDEGLSYMFGTFSDIIKDLSPAIKAFGGAFKGMVSILTAAVKLLIAPFNILIDLISYFSPSDKATSNIWAVIGAGGTIALLASRFKLVTYILKGMNLQLGIAIARIAAMVAPITAAFLAIEDVYTFTKGGDSYTGRAIQASKIAPSYMDWFAPVALTKMWQANMGSSTKVEVVVKDGEFSKAIEAKVVDTNQRQMANVNAEN